MKILLSSIFIFLLIPAAVAQNMPSQGNTGTTQECDSNTAECVSPDGSILSSPRGTTSQQGVSPNVIRTNNIDTEGRQTTPSDLQRQTDRTNAPLQPPTPPPPSDFEKFVQDTVGHPLPVFGRKLFQNPSSSFGPSTNIPAPSNYVVGPGDQILIRAWGKIDVNAPVTVDRNGQIFIPRVGTLTVAGLRVDQLTDFIHVAIAQQFKDFQLTVTMGQLRTIQVFVVGQAIRPGVHTISSLSTLVNALFESGGPLPTGSLRDIQVKRDGRTITHFDVYAFLLNGDNTADVHLLPGDIIDIPPVGPQIAIDGDVNTPAIYEMKTDSTVATAIDAAGGLTAVAETARATLEHIVNHTSRSLQEISLNAAGMRTPLKDGDILRVYPISPRMDDAVTLRGNVAQPGRYPWHSGMRVSDLIPNTDSLVTRAYYNQQNELDVSSTDHPFRSEAARVERRNASPPNETNQQGRAANQQSRVANQPYDATGAPINNANQPGGVPGQLSPNATPTRDVTAESNTNRLKDIADQSPGTKVLPRDEANRVPDVASHETEINWNYAVITRLNKTDLTTQLIPFVLREAITQPASAENKSLEPGDVVVIYSRKDLGLPLELQAKFVRIDGQVKAPGIYPLVEGETLRDMVKRAGGFTPHSYLYASQLTRESVRVEQETRMHNLLEQVGQEALSPANIVRNGPSDTGANATAELEIRKAYLARLSDIHPTGRVVLQLKPKDNSLEDVPDFLLQDGDHFFVPAAPNTVDVLGNVYNMGALRYLSGQRMGKYLDAAGGATRDGDKKREFILRADGTVISRQRVSKLDKLPIYPGDAIIIPPLLKGSAATYQLLNWTQIVSAFALTALAIKGL